MDRIKELSNFQLDASEDEASDDELPNSKPPTKEKNTSGKYFKQLVRLQLDELKNHPTARSAYASAIAHPMKQLERKFATVTLHKKPVKVIPWTTDEEVEEIIKLLKSIDPGFDINI